MRAAAGGGRLLQVLGVAFGLAVIVGNTIGVGILRTPGEIAAQLPSVPLFLLAWVGGGFYALLGAISLSELGAMVPLSGGQFVFVRRALGRFPGFLTGWTDWISTCGTTALAAIVLAEYLVPLVPPLAPYGTFLGSAVVLTFALLQWRGIRIGDAAQQITSLLKTLALLGLVAAVLLLPLDSAPATPAAPVPAGLGLLTAFVIAFQAVIFTYDGWTGAIYFGEEMKDPGRTIPRATIGGVLLVLGLYLALNLAFLRAVPIGAMAGDPFVAATAATTVFGSRGDTIIRILMILSLLAAINANVLMASRVPLAMGRDRLLPFAATRVNEGGTPSTALFAGTGLSLLLIATNTFDTILALLAFFFVANYVLSFTSVFVLRRREPDTPRPFRAIGYPWTTGLALAGSIAFLVASFVGDPANSARSLLLLAASVPVFLLIRGRESSARS
ncbi:MAG TPA: APC family permease [Gemmatimonadota bacterium]|jgi:APA family basic amino acid/polyamine antiporter